MLEFPFRVDFTFVLRSLFCSVYFADGRRLPSLPQPPAIVFHLCGVALAFCFFRLSFVSRDALAGATGNCEWQHSALSSRFESLASSHDPMQTQRALAWQTGRALRYITIVTGGYSTRTKEALR